MPADIQFDAVIFDSDGVLVDSEALGVVIEREAEGVGADLIALGTHGRTGLPRLLMGSVAERVLHHSPCAILTVRHSGDGDEQE